MTHVGSVITARGVAPKVNYQHKYNYTYLFGAYSPIDGSSVVLEIEQLSLDIFQAYLQQLAQYNPDQYKIVIIDNAGFHSTKNMTIPDNIHLISIPPRSPELNPCEQVWAYIKQRFKNRSFDSLAKLKLWLYDFVLSMTKNDIQSIVSNRHYLNAFYTKS